MRHVRGERSTTGRVASSAKDMRDTRATRAVDVSQTTNATNATKGPHRRRTWVEVDALRARALLDDDLSELGDGEREWVWRSLLKGIRVDEACVLALLDLDRLAEALEVVRARYEQRTRAYKEWRALALRGG